MDGKTLRGARAGDGRAVHVLAAMLSEIRAVVAQREIAHKTNEITAFAPLLAGLDLSGCWSARTRYAEVLPGDAAGDDGADGEVRIISPWIEDAPLLFTEREEHERSCVSPGRGHPRTVRGGLRVRLELLGYALKSRGGHLRLMADLSSWLGERGLDGSALSPQVVDGFVLDRRAVGHRDARSARSLRPLLEYLREVGRLRCPGSSGWRARWRRCWPTLPPTSATSGAWLC